MVITAMIVIMSVTVIMPIVMKDAGFSIFHGVYIIDSVHVTGQGELKRIFVT